MPWAAGAEVSTYDEGLILVPGFRASDAPRVTAAETLKAEDNGYRLACAWVGSRVFLTPGERQRLGCFGIRALSSGEGQWASVGRVKT